MSIGDLGLTAIIVLIQKLILPVLPDSLSFFPIDSFSTNLDSVKGFIIASFSGFGSIFPISLFLNLIVIIIFSELFLGIFKLGVFIINLVRGSGA